MSAKGVRVRAVAVLVLALAASAASADLLVDFMLRIPNEMAPAGGMVQMKVRTTEVTPISGGRPMFAFDAGMFSSVLGFGLFADGESAGAAIIDGNQVQLSTVSTATSAGDYPILTVSLPIRSDVNAGAKTQFTLDPRSVWNYASLGLISPSTIAPGTVSVGGTVAITDVVPGEGVWPAGTVVSVRGVGFSDKTSLRADADATKGVFVSPTEMRFMLLAPAEIRGMRIRASNPENQTTYYAYMRGITSKVSRRALLSMTEPIFGTAQRNVATLGPFGSLRSHQYAAIGLQNPNLSDVRVTLSLYDRHGSLDERSSFVLGARRRLALTVSELLDDDDVSAGSVVVVRAPLPIDAISLLCDEGSWSVAPSLPIEARQ